MTIWTSEETRNIGQSYCPSPHLTADCEVDNHNHLHTRLYTLHNTLHFTQDFTLAHQTLHFTQDFTLAHKTLHFTISNTTIVTSGKANTY